MVKLNQRSFARPSVSTGWPGTIASPGSATSRRATPSAGAVSVVLASWAATSSIVASARRTSLPAMASCSLVGPALLSANAA